jgi:hypothetical protein
VRSAAPAVADAGGPAPALGVAGAAVVLVVTLGLAVFLVAASWKLFSKAGQPGWGCLVPIYNFYLMCKIAGRPGWWTLLAFIPLVNFVIMIIVCIDIAKAFGQGAGVGLGLAFLGIIFVPVLAFGSATYRGAPA